MKKINLCVGFIVLALALFFTCDIIWHHCRGDNLGLTSYLSTALVYLISAKYLFIGFTAEKRQSIRMANLTAFYNYLLRRYQEAADPVNSKDMLTKKVFLSGVHDFGELVFDIESSSFPQELKDKADQMLQELLLKVIEVEDSMNTKNMKGAD